MQINIKKLPKGLVEISVELDAAETKPYLETAAVHISKEHGIKGYRPGHAPYEVVKSNVGEMAIYEHALGDIVRKAYVQAVKDNKLTTFGEPQVDVKKLAPGNPIAFTATVALVPKVLSVPPLDGVKVKLKATEIKDAEVENALKQLQKMRTKEAAVDREVRPQDKIVVDMDMSLGGVPLEGGQARGHGIYLDEEYYIPGLKEQVLGLKPGEKKNFKLKFPADHYQKNLASKDVDFALTLKQVYELAHPELNDEFAKGLGQENMAKLRELLRKNMEEEARDKELRRAENEALEKIAEKSKFEEMPEAIVNQEVDRMVHELSHEVAERGLKFDEYLQSLKKTLGEMKLEMAPQAVKRIKVALALREIGDREHIEAPDTEVLAEQNRLINAYAEDAETQDRIRSEDYQDYLRSVIRNKKIVEKIREQSIEK